jgi:hypothetical protein
MGIGSKSVTVVTLHCDRDVTVLVKRNRDSSFPYRGVTCHSSSFSPAEGPS